MSVEAKAKIFRLGGTRQVFVCAHDGNMFGVAMKKPDCFYYSFPAMSMTKRRVGH